MRLLSASTRRSLPFVAALLLPISLHAAEGMWLPEQLPALATELEQAGLALDPDDLADLSTAPLGAIVSLGGCSASFVSDQGLVVTNHHCAVRALQHNSTAENNVLQDGFSANQQADELWAGPSARVYVTQSIEDVTDEVLGAIPEGASDVERYEAIDQATKALVAACESEPHVRCSIPSYHGGSSYRRITQLEIEDVRIAYAPPSMIGFYGGDIDNWMWPRHTGDFAFFRAYVGPDGQPAPHAEENVPFAPEHHLTIRTAELDEGDFVMVAGYPGRTYRQRTGNEMAYARDVSYPWNIATMGDMLAELEAAFEVSEDAAVRAQSFQFGLENYLKNNRGMLDGFRTSGAVERALARDAQVRTHDAETMDALDASLADSRADADRDRLLGWMGWGASLLNVANTALWLAHERQKADEDRDQGYQERDWPRLHARIAALDATWDPEIEARMLAYFMTRLTALEDPALADAVAHFASFGDDPLTAARAMVAQSVLIDAEERGSALDATVEDIENARDPLYALAAALYPLRRAIHDTRKATDGALSRLRPSYVGAVRASVDGPVYPDANSTLRVTYGQIRGYDGPDAVWYRPFTTVQGIVAKHTGEDPFDAPQALRDAIEAGEWGAYEDADLGTVPVNFLSTLDTTGGNSGSATLDGEGQLCGLLFDGNYEAMGSDWVFDPVATRSIHVSAAYMLWVMEFAYPQPRLLEELGVQQ